MNRVCALLALLSAVAGCGTTGGSDPLSLEGAWRVEYVTLAVTDTLVNGSVTKIIPFDTTYADRRSDVVTITPDLLIYATDSTTASYAYGTDDPLITLPPPFLERAGVTTADSAEYEYGIGGNRLTLDLTRPYSSARNAVGTGTVRRYLEKYDFVLSPAD